MTIQPMSMNSRLMRKMMTWGFEERWQRVSWAATRSGHEGSRRTCRPYVAPIMARAMIGIGACPMAEVEEDGTEGQGQLRSAGDVRKPAR